MATAELNARLRRYRSALVVSAERIVREVNTGTLPAKTQFSHLVALCGEASCAEEIENFLRYQAGRRAEGREKWTPPFVTKVIDGLHGATADLRGDDAAKVEAWRLYAVYLMRAFTYEDAISRARSRR